MAGVPHGSVMSKARHACRNNYFHSDVVTIGQAIHKIIDIQHITEDDERAVGIRMMHELGVECFIMLMTATSV